MSLSSVPLYIGLMSGTSCDGVDGVLVRFSDKPGTLSLSATHSIPFDSDFRQSLHALQQPFFPSRDPFHLAALAANGLMDIYAEVVQTLLSISGYSAESVRAIGCHGQTIRHHPQAGYTIQIHNAARLVEKTGIAVIADWRSRDIAAGGQGAPLVPAFHQWLFGDAERHRVVLNLGGIANVTDLVPSGDVRGFDCGPANTLMDMWIMHHRGHAYDRDGVWGASGQVSSSLLARLKSDVFFSRLPPKSTGRDYFNLQWLESYLDGNEQPQDVQATLMQLTAETTLDAVISHCPGAEEILVCGGGVNNSHLMSLFQQISPIPIRSTATAGLPPQWVEAAAFAWLTYQTIHGHPGTLSSVTGASGARIAGAIYPR